MSKLKAGALAAINEFVAAETAPERSRRETMRGIEEKHLGRCIDQAWGNGRRSLIELMEVRGTQKQAVVIKQYEERVPLSGSSKLWPELAGVWVFVPIEKDGDNTWAGLDAQLATFREMNKPKA